MTESLNLTGGNRYVLRITGDSTLLQNPLELQIQDITFPGVSSGIMDIPTPIRPISFPGKSLTFDDLYVSFILSETLSEWLFLYNWITSINFGSSISSTDIFGNGELFITTNKFNPIISFTFEHLFPYMLGTFELSTNITTMESVTSNATFKFANMTINNDL